jgi:nucleoid DNA-binding protein
MSNKEAYIDFIIEQLNLGNVQYKDVVSLFCDKFRLTERTFDKWWKIANQKHSEKRQAIEKAKMEQSIKTEVEAVRSQIKSKEEILLKLGEIIDQKAKRVEGVIVMPTYTDVKGAIDLYNKMQGYYAPTKSENKIESNVTVDPQGYIDSLREAMLADPDFDDFD